MLPFAYFLLKVTICSAVLFCYYWFFLRNKVFHAYNRFYLLTIVVLSLTLPLCRINIFHKAEVPKTNVIKVLQVITVGDEYMDDVIINTPNKHVSFTDLAPLLYLTVSVVFLIMLFQMLFYINSLKRKNEKRLINDIHFINTDNGKGTPFSFFKYIFWNKDIDMNSPAGNRIFRHELAHIQERHSWDKMFMNIVLIVFWCNPVFWLIRRELCMIHEFIADKRAVEDGDTAAFASMILAASYPQHRFAITNNFFYSPIKRRLMMLTKKQNARINYFSRLAVLPLLLFVFAAFAFKAKTLGTEKHNPLNPIEKIINKITGNKSEDKKDDKDASQVTPADKQITVVIDAGHGGEDAGARNKNGITEKDLALELVKKIKELNTNQNIKIILTRETDKFSSPKEKAEFAKAQNPDLFISVHLDNTPKEKWNTVSGMNVFVARDDIENAGKSKVLASTIINAFKNNYNLNVATIISQRQKGIWILQANTFPSVLIEAGYLTNDADAKYLQSEKGQETFAKNVLDAISSYAAFNLTTLNHTINTQQTSDSTIYYKGKKVKSYDVSVNANEGNVTGIKLIFYDNTVKIISVEEAKKIGIKLPSMQNNRDASVIEKSPVYLSDTTKENKSSVELDVASKENIKLFKGLGHVFIRSETDGEIPYKDPKILIIRDGVIQQNSTNTKIYKGDLFVLLKSNEAVEKYGNKAFAGAVEITSKSKYAESLIHKPSLRNIQDTHRIVFTKAETEAEFPGGNSAMASFLKTNLILSIPKNEGWKPGTYSVVLKFIVEKDGSLTDIQTENYIGTKTAQHCISIFKACPKWKPAVQNGHVVSAYTRQTINFILTGTNGVTNFDQGRSNYSQEISNPVFRVGNLSNPRVSVELFKKQEVVTVTDGYEFVEATVLFSGAGFPNVISAPLSEKSLKNLIPFINRCVAGTNITFDNITVKNHLGLKTIGGKSYSLL